MEYICNAMFYNHLNLDCSNTYESFAISGPSTINNTIFYFNFFILVSLN